MPEDITSLQDFKSHGLWKVIFFFQVIFFFPFAARVELSCFWTKGFGVPCFLGDLYPTDAFRYLVLKYTHI